MPPPVSAGPGFEALYDFAAEPVAGLDIPATLNGPGVTAPDFDISCAPALGATGLTGAITPSAGHILPLYRSRLQD